MGRWIKKDIYTRDGIMHDEELIDTYIGIIKSI